MMYHQLSSRFVWLRQKINDVTSSLSFHDVTYQLFFIFGSVGLFIFAVVYAVPDLYESSGENTIVIGQIICCFLASQAYINWICMKLVDTSYDPVRDGRKPVGIELGEDVSRLKEADNANTDSTNDSELSDMAINKRNTTTLNGIASDQEEPIKLAKKQTSFPYFSWTPCMWCNRPRPPRCHHCPLCNACVLKRDHHCFVSGKCIGYKNLRHFSVFLFWTAFTTILCTIHALPYYYYHVLSETSVFDLLFPVAITRAIFGYISWRCAFFVVVVWILTFCLFWSYSYLRIVVNLIKTGKTTFEIDSRRQLTDSRRLSEKLKSVFGDYWFVNMFVPLHFMFEPLDDPIRWPYMHTLQKSED